MQTSSRPASPTSSASSSSAEVLDEVSCDRQFQAVRILEGDERGAVYFLAEGRAQPGEIIRVSWWYGDQFARREGP
jgi:hypothetical protein